MRKRLAGRLALPRLRNTTWSPACQHKMAVNGRIPGVTSCHFARLLRVGDELLAFLRGRARRYASPTPWRHCVGRPRRCGLRRSGFWGQCFLLLGASPRCGSMPFPDDEQSGSQQDLTIVGIVRCARLGCASRCVWGAMWPRSFCSPGGAISNASKRPPTSSRSSRDEAGDCK